MSVRFWIMSTYVWAFCAVGWGWIAYIMNYGPGLVLCLWCAVMAVWCGNKAET